MPTISEIARYKVYPLGEVTEETRRSLIMYLKELLGKALYIDNTYDYERILLDWYNKDCVPMLHQKDLDIQYRNTLDIIIQTLQSTKTEAESLNKLSRPYYIAVPKAIRCNDYIPITTLLERLRELD